MCDMEVLKQNSDIRTRSLRTVYRRVPKGRFTDSAGLLVTYVKRVQCVLDDHVPCLGSFVARHLVKDLKHPFAVSTRRVYEEFLAL